MTPLERATQGVKAEMMRQFGKHAENSQRPVHYATAALDAAPDFDQLIEWLHTCQPEPDGCVGCIVEGRGLGASEIEVLVRAFISYLQQGIEQEQPHLAAVAA